MLTLHAANRTTAGRYRTALVALALACAAALTTLVGAGPADAKPRCPKGAVCDTTAPDTTIVSGPTGTISATSATFEFSANEAGSTFHCRLNGSSWAGCTSPKSYTGLAAASYTFEVRAVDPSGNVDASPASRAFTVAGTTTPPPPGGKATTRPVGSPALSDAEAAARVVRSTWEPRPGNATANSRVPTATELANFRSQNSTPALYKDKVTGNFTGTTDETIQWAAHKWGIDEDVIRAAAVKESWWYMSAIGDNGVSYGLMQIKSTVSLGTYPLSQESTAFNVDYYGASIRYYFDGQATWLNDPCCYSGTWYAAGDLWGAVGAWFAGRWYTPGAVDYINSVKSHLSSRTWAQAGF